jgi:hypothetical protein
MLPLPGARFVVCDAICIGDGDNDGSRSFLSFGTVIELLMVAVFSVITLSAGQLRWLWSSLSNESALAL